MEVCLKRDLLTFYSFSIRDMMLSMSKTITGSSTDLVISMPDFSVVTLMKLRTLLETGCNPGFSSEEDICELLDAARCLGVEMDGLERGGVLYTNRSVTRYSAVSVKQEILHSDTDRERREEQEDIQLNVDMPSQSQFPSPDSSPPVMPAEAQLALTVIEPEMSASNITLELDSSSRKKTGLDCNYSLVCELCGVATKSDSQLEDHMSSHFMPELQAMARRFISPDLTCQKCGDVFKVKKRLILHLGKKHGIINEVLKKNNLRVLPSSVNASYSAAKQKKLRKIKMEKVEHQEDIKKLLMD